MLRLVRLTDDRSATVIVALAGHGIMDPKAEKSFFCPADTSAVNLSTTRSSTWGHCTTRSRHPPQVSS